MFKKYREWRKRMETVSWIVVDRVCLKLDIKLNEMWNRKVNEK